MSQHDITIRFKRAPDCRNIVAHGVWGGVGPTGDITAQIFTDYRESPDSITLDISKNPAAEIGRKGSEEIIREIQTSLIMKPDVAHAVGQWLVQKATEAGFMVGKRVQQ